MPLGALRLSRAPDTCARHGAGLDRRGRRLLATLWSVCLLDTLLFGISARDPLAYAIVILGVVCVALLANRVPARRAAAVDPMRALRFE